MGGAKIGKGEVLQLIGAAAIEALDDAVGTARSCRIRQRIELVGSAPDGRWAHRTGVQVDRARFHVTIPAHGFVTRDIGEVVAGHRLQVTGCRGGGRTCLLRDPAHSIAQACSAPTMLAGTVFWSPPAFARSRCDLGTALPPAMLRFGIYDAPPLDVAPGTVKSTGPAFNSFENNKPRFALAGIGQGDVFTSPLQMALVAAGIAHGGVIMKPHVGWAGTDGQGRKSAPITPEVWGRGPLKAKAATQA